MMNIYLNFQELHEKISQTVKLKINENYVKKFKWDFELHSLKINVKKKFYLHTTKMW